MHRLLFWLLSFAFIPNALAQGSPDELVKSVTNEVLQILKSDKELQSGNTRKAAALIEEKVLPHFNFTRMTALAVGQHWRKATPEQQKALTDQFRTLLVRTYSTALTSYRNQTIEYKPTRMQPTDTEVTVRSEVKQQGGEPIQLEYNMEKNDTGWKVYDVVIAGVSLVTTYRETFNAEIRTSGIDGLIKALQTKNQTLATRS